MRISLTSNTIISVALSFSFYGCAHKTTGTKDAVIDPIVSTSPTSIKIETKDHELRFKYDPLVIPLPVSFFHFATAKSELQKVGIKYAESLAKILKEYQYSWDHFEIVGHADKRGSRQMNQRLSEDRAKAVVDILLKNDVESAKIQSEGMGFDSPINPADDLKAYAQNRRVELRVFGNGNAEALKKDLDDYTRTAGNFKK